MAKSIFLSSSCGPSTHITRPVGKEEKLSTDVQPTTSHVKICPMAQKLHVHEVMLQDRYIQYIQYRFSHMRLEVENGAVNHERTPPRFQVVHVPDSLQSREGYSI